MADKVTTSLSEAKILVMEGQKGKTGDTGKSAYQLAVEHGYDGSETEWLASLKGEPGTDGRDGVDGAPGKDGKDGVDGAPGAPGEDGVSPAVTVTQTASGHTVTITDAEHPNGQSFNVLDGETPDLIATLDENGVLMVEGMSLVSDYDTEVF